MVAERARRRDRGACPPGSAAPSARTSRRVPSGCAHQLDRLRTELPRRRQRIAVPLQVEALPALAEKGVEAEVVVAVRRADVARPRRARPLRRGWSASCRAAAPARGSPRRRGSADRRHAREQVDQAVVGREERRVVGDCRRNAAGRGRESGRESADAKTASATSSTTNRGLTMIGLRRGVFAPRRRSCQPGARHPGLYRRVGGNRLREPYRRSHSKVTVLLPSALLVARVDRALAFIPKQ